MISIMDYLPALWRREIKNRIVKIWVQQPLSQRRLGMHFCISISQWRLTKNLRLKIVFVQTKILTLKTIYLLGSINEKTLAFRDLCALQWSSLLGMWTISAGFNLAENVSSKSKDKSFPNMQRIFPESKTRYEWWRIVQSLVKETEVEISTSLGIPKH